MISRFNCIVPYFVRFQCNPARGKIIRVNGKVGKRMKIIIFIYETRNIVL